MVPSEYLAVEHGVYPPRRRCRLHRRPTSPTPYRRGAGQLATSANFVVKVLSNTMVATNSPFRIEVSVTT